MNRIHTRLAALPVLLAAAAYAQNQPAPRPAPAATWSTPAFSVGIDAHGLITALANPQDAAHMNWVREAGPAWGVPMSRENGKLTNWGPPTLAASAENRNELHFTHGGLGLALKQALAGGQLTQEYTLTNTTQAPIALAEGDFGIRVPLPDNYPDAVTALTQRCNVHLWMGENSSWINAQRMNGRGPHLGMVLRAGSLTAYSITDRPWNSNDRGTFVTHPAAQTLAPGQSLTVAWSIFWHEDWEDFFATARQVPGFVHMQADRYTITQGDTLHVHAETGGGLMGDLTVNGRPVASRSNNGVLDAEVTPTTLGDQVFELTTGSGKTHLRAYVSADPGALVEARVRFIIEHQQQHAPGTPADNAFLAYDNETKKIVLERTNDRNAGRERVGMGVLLALAWPRCQDGALKAKITDALNGYWAYVTAHLQDANGRVYNDADNPAQRLYNYPWVADLHLAMYAGTREARYLDAYVRTIHSFYANGGQRFYPIGLPIREGLAALTAAGRGADHDALLALFRAHGDRILATGTAMPKSEVNYEQSIVGPACQILLEMGEATGDKKYLDGAQPLLSALFAFNGMQPDYHVNDLSIRHWDDYWFGKAKLYGDTFPHYWSTITATVLEDQARLARAAKDPIAASAAHARAMNILANNFSLFHADGSASCAYVYPLTINDQPGRLYDPWANDQDWALVNYLKLAPPAPPN